MAHISGIKEHMEIIGADGVHVGTVDNVEGDRIKLTKRDSGEGGHQGHHHYLSTGLVAEVEGQKVRLSANAANAFMFEEEKDGSARGATDTVRDRSDTPDRASASGRNQERMSVDWTSIGLGAAAVGAVAGAALLARKGSRPSDEFEMRLQTDESLRLISSSKVEGTPVVGRGGEHLGKIESFMVDKYSGQVAYAVMSFGGTLGFGDSLFPLPWSALNYDVEKDGYVLGITKEQIATAPKFKASDAPEFSTSYRQGLARFYGRSSM
jgi:hypothetical protein